MKKTIKFIIALLISCCTFYSCQDMDDIAISNELEIQDFIWKGLNLYYLWQADVPNLADNRFSTQTQLNTFLTAYPEPKELFDDLRISKSIDRFSWIVSDYTVLEQSLEGTSKNNGVDYGLRYKSAISSDIFGYVRYIIPNSDASDKDIHRGDIFYAVNGTQLTANNYSGLLGTDTYTLNLANYDNGNITPNGRSISLTKTTLSENPIFINKVITNGNHKIGYLMYNGFYANYDTQLNDAFATLKNAGITDLVLDLRYNSGGSVLTATRLASMITGQYTGEVFAKQRWNDKINSYFESSNPDRLRNNFTDKIGSTEINSLKLNKIYILTTVSTASASELIINGLKPYMNVVQIGDKTTGKNVGSVTLYDSPTFGKENRNSNHKYAMQPIVLKIVNAAEEGDFFNGITPTYSLKEDLGNLNQLGQITEPLLSTAIGKITGTAKMIKQGPVKDFIHFKDAKSIDGLKNQMYIEKAPEGLLKALE